MAKREVVVITGASAGVGRAAVREFARQGASVGLIARGTDGLEAARREVEAAGGRFVFDVPAVGATSDSDLFDEGLRDVPFVRPLFDSAAAAEQQAIREQLAQDLSLLAQERDEFRQQRDIDTQQLAARIAQVEDEAGRGYFRKP